MGHTVLEYGQRDAQTVEPGRHIYPFVVNGQVKVSAAGAGENDNAVGIFRRINIDHRMGDIAYTSIAHHGFNTRQAAVVRGAFGPYFQFDRRFLRHGGRRHSGGQANHHQMFQHIHSILSD